MFNKHDVDVIVRYKKSEDQNYLKGWNLHSIKTIEKILKKNQLKIVSLKEFKLPLNLSPKKDPLRSWTLNTPNGSKFVNGLGQIYSLYCFKIKKMLKILLITSNSKRHQYFKLRLENYKSKKYKIIFTFIEKENSKVDKVFKSNLEKNHLDARNISEIDFFDNYISNCEIKKETPKSLIKVKSIKTKKYKFYFEKKSRFYCYLWMFYY